MKPLLPLDRRTQSRNLAVFTLAFFAVWSIRATILYPVDESIMLISPAWREIYAAAVRVLLWIVPVFGYLIIVDKVDALQFLRLNTLIDWKGLLQGSVIVIIFFVLSISIPYALAGPQRHISVNAQPWPWYAIFLSLPIAPICEEILFRGFLLRKCQAFMGFWPANLAASLLFVAVHWPYWLYSHGFGIDRIALSISILMLGMLSGYLMKRANSLWPSIAMHLLNNFLSGILIVG